MAGLDLERVYRIRFEGEERMRRQVWAVLSRRFFSRWIQPTDVVVDLGAGYCEFINSVRAAGRYALDLNPATAGLAGDGVKVLAQDAAEDWALAPDAVDVVFSSNFLEHIPSKHTLLRVLRQALRALRPGGLFIALGPNIRFCSSAYWDYFDHHIPLSDRSLGEALAAVGFVPELVFPRFLPYTMKGRLASARSPLGVRLFLLRLYLRCPVLWRVAGKQFLIVARKPNGQAADDHRTRL